MNDRSSAAVREWRIVTSDPVLIVVSGFIVIETAVAIDGPLLRHPQSAQMA
jgi:hypothetical protein